MQLKFKKIVISLTSGFREFCNPMNVTQSVIQGGLTSGKSAKPKVINKVRGYISLPERSSLPFEQQISILSSSMFQVQLSSLFYFYIGMQKVTWPLIFHGLTLSRIPKYFFKEKPTQDFVPTYKNAIEVW